MNKFGTRCSALILATTAVAAVGCGSSSKTTSSATTSAASAPSTPATPSTPTSTTNVNLNTPITSPAARALLIKGEQSQFKGRFNQRQVNSFTDCVVKKFEAAGVRTLGDLEQHQSEAKTFGAQCASSLRS